MEATHEAPVVTGARLPELGVWAWDVPEDRHVWSPVMLALFDVACAPRTEAEFLALVHPEDRVRLEGEAASILSGGESFSREYRIVRRDGTMRWLHDRGAVLRCAAGIAKRVTGFCLDVTDQRNLSREQTLLHLALKDGVEGVWDYDVQADASRWDATVYRLFGVERGVRVSARMIERLVHPDDRARVAAAARQALSPDGSGRYAVEHRVCLPGGFERWVAVTGRTLFMGEGAARRAVRMIGTARDVTDRHVTEDALVSSEARLHRACRAARMALLDIEFGAGEPRAVHTPNLHEMLGLPPGGAITTEAFFARVHPEDRARVMADHAELARTGGGYTAEFRVVLDDGTVRWLQVQGEAQPGPDGMPARLSSVTLDITRRKTAEEFTGIVVAELKHRLKNTIAIVQGLALRSFGTLPGADGARAVFEGRVSALADAHDALVLGGRGSATLSSLLDGALRGCSIPFGRIRAEGPDLRLNSRQSVALALALHELLTNALKHGCLKQPAGRVTIAWEATGPNRFALRWQEVDGPEVTPPPEGDGGFGLKLLRRLVGVDLNGSFDARFAPEGFSCRIEGDLCDR